MDQIKTGKFIAEERKNKKLTQRQLADTLNISDKTISKWETGNGFPEISLLQPLCQALDISVNELLSGERLSEDEYKKKAEENMMDIMKEKTENKKSMRRVFISGAVATVSFITLCAILEKYSYVMTTAEKVIITAVAILIFGVGIAGTMSGERSIGYYKCKSCGELFQPSMAAYIFGMHVGTTRHLKCPACGERTWCIKVYSKEE